MESDTFTTRSGTTRSGHPGDQFDAWREPVRPFRNVLIRPSFCDGFEAGARVWQLGGIAVSRAPGPTEVVVRQDLGRTRDHVDHGVLACCESTVTRIRTARTNLEVPAGVPFLWCQHECSLDAARDSGRAQADWVQIHLPRGVLRAIAPQIDAAGVTVLDTPCGHLLGDCMLALERRLPRLSTAELPRLGQAVLGMLGACFAPPARQVAAERSQIELGRLERVQQTISKHLCSPALGSKMLCRLVGMSRSNLYRLFEETGGVARYIQSQRLLKAHEALCDATDRRTISVIAEDLCFASASGFSRAFRHEFGLTPSEVRSACEALGAARSSGFPAPHILAGSHRNSGQHASDQIQLSGR